MVDCGPGRSFIARLVWASMMVVGYLETHPGGLHTKSGWALVMFLSTWQDGVDGEVRAEPLRVVLPPEQEDLQVRTGRFLKGAAVTIDVRTIEPPGEVPYWNAEGALPVRPASPGKALMALRHRLEQLVVFVDAVLGLLTLEREYHRFRGSCRCRGLSCDVLVTRTALEEDREADQRDIDTAREAVVRIVTRLPEVLDAAAAELHGVWNQSWRQERLPLSRKAFAEQLKIRTIEIERARHTLWLDAGDLFDGHEVELRLSPSGEIEEVGLAG